MTKIIAFAGKKRSGKNTAANFLHGHVLKLNEVIKDFSINDTGELVVNSVYIDGKGQVKEELGVLDLTQQNDMFYGYADAMIWPHIKLYHFADALKEICCSMFGLSYNQVYGSEKESITNLKWENMPGVLTDKECRNILSRSHVENTELLTIEDLQNIFGDQVLVKEAGLMTVREVMQYVGTDVFRRMNPKVWTDLVLNKIRAEQPRIAVIADCRFDNEGFEVQANGGIVVYLDRNIHPSDVHASENGFKNLVPNIVVNNNSMSIEESNNAILNKLISLGVSELVVKAD